MDIVEKDNEVIEVWVGIERAPRYSVSSLGRVRNDDTGRILKPRSDGRGYSKVILATPQGRWSVSIHRLVATAFYEGPHDGYDVNHDDGDKTNNFVGNLLFETRSENMSHAWRNGLIGRSGRYRRGQIIVNETGEIFDSVADCARALHLDKSVIGKCLRGKIGQHKGYTFDYVSEE